jgi:hypothetical protein
MRAARTTRGREYPGAGYNEPLVAVDAGGGIHVITYGRHEGYHYLGIYDRYLCR